MIFILIASAAVLMLLFAWATPRRRDAERPIHVADLHMRLSQRVMSLPHEDTSFLSSSAFWEGWDQLYAQRSQITEGVFSGPLLFPSAFGSRQFIMCLIPKAGSTSWKRLATRLQGQEHRSDMAQVHNNARLAWLQELSPEGLARVLADPATPRLMVVRNPYARLLSAYMVSNCAGAVVLRSREQWQLVAV